MSSTNEHVRLDTTGALQPMMTEPIMTLGWVFRRALLGLLILILAVSGAAWLTYASIDSSDAPNGKDSSQSPVETAVAGY
jgi:hypothetical protein